MNAIDDNTTVAEVALQHPQAKPVLERLGIDYCCGGDRPFGQAVKDSGHSLEEVRREIDRAVERSGDDDSQGPDWSTATATELAHHILETHHVFMKRELPRLSSLLAKAIDAHEAKHGEMLRALQQQFRALRTEIEQHLMKEEQILFPYIEQLDQYAQHGGPAPVSHCGTVQNPIRQMEHEHDNAGAALETMRRITSDYELPEDACPTFESLYDGLKAMEADLHEHIHLENNLLFPQALKLERDASENS